MEFLPSNRFRLVRLTLPTEGHYEVKDDKAYLHVETLLGAAVDPKSSDAKLNEGLTIEHKADGTLLMKDPLSFGNQEIVLKRAQPEA